MKPVNSDFSSPAGGCPDIALAANRCSMIVIGDSDYASIAAIIADAIGGREFFNGSVTYDCGEFGSRLTATLIIYRDKADPGIITGVVPVWWEFSTITPDGLPAPNDFSFGLLKQSMIDN